MLMDIALGMGPAPINLLKLLSDKLKGINKNKCFRSIYGRHALEHKLSGVRGLLFFFQAEDGIRDLTVTGVQTCALPISRPAPWYAYVDRKNRSTSTIARASSAGRSTRSTNCARDDMNNSASADGTMSRSEERRVGKECRSRWSPYH